MFAGPNGSGKSTLKSVLSADLLGVYLNPDDIEGTLKSQGFLDLTAIGIELETGHLQNFFERSELMCAAGISVRPSLMGNRLSFSPAEHGPYLASVLADFLRQRLIAARMSFTFETVMSHPGKISVLRQAQEAGFRTYLYYVATDDPEINVSRVRNRVRLGGHPVPEDKITARYHRSLDLLMEAIRSSNRAYIFDNSGHEQERVWLAEVTEGCELELKTDRVPAWFKRAVLDKVGQTAAV